MTDSEFTFYFLRFMLGVAEAGFFPGIILYLTYWFPSEIRARKVALFMTAIAIANVIGSPISGGIMQFMDGVHGWRGWQWLFLLEGIPSVLVGILVFWLLPNGPRKTPWLTTAEQDLIIKRVEQDHAAKKDLGQKHSLRDAFGDARVWWLSLVYFCGVVCFYAVTFWLPTIVQELGIDKKDFLKVGLVSMIPWGIATVAMVVNGHHSDKTGERRWHSAGGLLVALVGLMLLSIGGHNAVIGITWPHAGHLGDPVLGRVLLVLAHRLPVRNGGGRGHCLDQLGRQPRWLRGSDGDRLGSRPLQVLRAGVLFTCGMRLARCIDHPVPAWHAARPGAGAAAADLTLAVLIYVNRRPPASGYSARGGVLRDAIRSPG